MADDKLTEGQLEQKVFMYEHFWLGDADESSLAQAVDYLIEGESSDTFIHAYARGYAELVDRVCAELRARAEKAERWLAIAMEGIGHYADPETGRVWIECDEGGGDKYYVGDFENGYDYARTIKQQIEQEGK